VDFFTEGKSLQFLTLVLQRGGRRVRGRGRGRGQGKVTVPKAPAASKVTKELSV
jgi:hypothetical protein